MSGSVNLHVPSYLPTLYGGGSTDISLLETLHGIAVMASEVTNSIASPPQTRPDEPEQMTRVGAEPAPQRDIASFAEAHEGDGARGSAGQPDGPESLANGGATQRPGQ
jgi:hypothetical protein